MIKGLRIFVVSAVAAILNVPVGAFVPRPAQNSALDTLISRLKDEKVEMIGLGLRTIRSRTSIGARDAKALRGLETVLRARVGESSMWYPRLSADGHISLESMGSFQAAKLRLTGLDLSVDLLGQPSTISPTVVQELFKQRHNATCESPLVELSSPLYTWFETNSGSMSNEQSLSLLSVFANHIETGPELFLFTRLLLARARRTPSSLEALLDVEAIAVNRAGSVAVGSELLNRQFNPLGEINDLVELARESSVAKRRLRFALRAFVVRNIEGSTCGDGEKEARRAFVAKYNALDGLLVPPGVISATEVRFWESRASASGGILRGRGLINKGTVQQILKSQHGSSYKEFSAQINAAVDQWRKWTPEDNRHPDLSFDAKATFLSALIVNLNDYTSRHMLAQVLSGYLANNPIKKTHYALWLAHAATLASMAEGSIERLNATPITDICDVFRASGDPSLAILADLQTIQDANRSATRN